MMSEGLFDGKPTAFYDLYRLEEGKQVEHWVALETIPPSSGVGEFQRQVVGRTRHRSVFK
jgi:predicted SnoaL-like aldol condensation-catalyzing enzyme